MEDIITIFIRIISSNKARKRIIFFGIIFTVIIFYINHTLIEQRKRKSRFLKDCFHNLMQPNIEALPEIGVFHTPMGRQNVFFLETSCAKPASTVNLNARQLCAVESAAKNSPNWNIYVLFAANIGFLNDTTDLEYKMLDAVLSTYANIKFLRLNITNYGENTPLATWMRDGKMFDSDYINSHLSDVLRYLTLYKYGGTYLDLDVVALKNLDEAGVNYSGAESDEDVAAGFMNMEPSGFGHQVAEMCVNDLLENFDGYNWGNNGPGVITRVLQTLCGTKLPQKMIRDRCYGFHVYPPEGVYAIPWRKYRMFFEEKDAEETLSRLENSFIAHLWNKHSHQVKLKVGSKAAYAKLAETHCPQVYSHCGSYF